MIAQTHASFAETMRRTGVVPAVPIGPQLQPGKFARFPIEGDPPRVPSGWARLSDDGRVLSFGSHRTGAKGSWQDDSAPRAQLTPVERAAIAQRIARQRQVEEAVAAQVRTMWDASEKADDWHPALRRLDLFAAGVRASGNAILVPMLDAEFRLWNVLQIYGVENAPQRHPFKGGRRAGLFWAHHIVRRDGMPTDKPLVLVDRYEAASAIHAPTGLPVVSSMTTENLVEVARIMRDKFPRREIIIAAYDDRGQGEPYRMRAAVIAANAIGAKVAIPTPLDWLARDGLGFDRLQFGDVIERIAAAERIGGGA